MYPPPQQLRCGDWPSHWMGGVTIHHIGIENLAERKIILAWIGSAMLLVATCDAQTQRERDTSALTAKSLKQFLQTFTDDKTTRYVVAFPDLNGDRTPEAIVYLISNGWCGSGGCTMLILARDGATWRVVTQVTITRPPIRVLTSTSHGWHNISVWVRGGGILPGYEAELRFDGKTYPSNPSMPPARRLAAEGLGAVAILSMEGGTLLYP